MEEEWETKPTLVIVYDKHCSFRTGALTTRGSDQFEGSADFEDSSGPIFQTAYPWIRPVVRDDIDSEMLLSFYNARCLLVRAKTGHAKLLLRKAALWCITCLLLLRMVAYSGKSATVCTYRQPFGPNVRCSIPTWATCTQSVWLISFDETADLLVAHVDG